MNFVQKSYRVTRTPQKAYDAMIFVALATPITVFADLVASKALALISILTKMQVYAFKISKST